MSRLLAVLLLLPYYLIAGCPSGYLYYRDITLPARASTLTDFPVLICANSTTGTTCDGALSNLSWPELKTVANGGKIQNTVSGTSPYSRTIPADLVFYEGMSKLAHEVEKYSATTGEFIGYVKVTLTTGTKTIQACYDNSSVVTDQSDTVNTWDTNFKAVYHMGESVTTTLYNSTSTAGVDMTGTGLTSVDGIYGKAMDFATGDSAVPASSTPFNNLGSFTLSSWVRIDAYTANLLSRWFEKTMAGTFNNSGQLLFGGAFQGGSTGVWTISGLTTATWFHLAVTFNTSSNTNDPVIYVNGASVTVTESAAPTGSWDDSGNTVRWANNAGNTRFLDGKLKEIRWSNTIRNAEWIDAEYDNTNSPSTFYTLGAEQDVVPPPPVMVGNGLIAVCCPMLAPLQAAGVNAIWTWYNDPRAVRYGDSTYWGGVTSAGTVRAFQFNHSTGVFKTFDLDVALEVDDHDNPAFLRLASGKIVAMWSKHNGASYYKISTNADDISAWGSRITLSADVHSYINLYKMADGVIWLFYRGTFPANGEPYFRTTNDTDILTNTWSTGAQFIENGSERPYMKYRSDGDHTVHMGFTDGHPDALVNTNIYYARLDTDTGTFYKADGTVIGTTASAWLVSAGDKVWDSATGGGKAWIWEVGYDRNNYPVLVYTQYPGASGYTVPEIKYRYARWTGTAWEDHEIRDAGGALYYNGADPSNPLVSSPYYACGVTLDHLDPSRVYLSYNTGDNTDCENMVEYTTEDNGVTWTTRSILTTGNNARPFVVLGNTTETWLSWWEGTYPSYINYLTNARIKRVR